MKTQVAATYVGGQFKPDESVPFPEAARVQLTIDVIDDELELAADEVFHGDPAKSIAAWEELKEWIRNRPIHGLGRRLTRDELHERR